MTNASFSSLFLKRLLCVVYVAFFEYFLFGLFFCVFQCLVFYVCLSIYIYSEIWTFLLIRIILKATRFVQSWIIPVCLCFIILFKNIISCTISTSRKTYKYLILRMLLNFHGYLERKSVKCVIFVCQYFLFNM